VKATILHVEGQSYMAKAESNHWLPLDSGLKGGGSGAASSPVELLLIACGSCVAMDVVHIFSKSRTSFSKFSMEMDATRAESHPRRFTEVYYHAIIESSEATADFVRRALELSLTKYCSVALSLDRSVRLLVKFTLNGVEQETRQIARHPEVYS
jgi:putative redox protein